MKKKILTLVAVFALTAGTPYVIGQTGNGQNNGQNQSGQRDGQGQQKQKGQEGQKGNPEGSKDGAGPLHEPGDVRTPPGNGQGQRGRR